MFHASITEESKDKVSIKSNDDLPAKEEEEAEEEEEEDDLWKKKMCDEPTSSIRHDCTIPSTALLIPRSTIS